ncbi:MAG: ribulose-phosphate 3-epimerase [Planctomycetaceae bacterium]|nr:ribulose-phosphate 3-epimerase [Planctomycetaceae bacterium]
MLQELLTSAPLINPSLLAADFGNLEREIRCLESGGAKILHLDIMDGHFVPNLSIGVPVVESIRKITDLPLDVHLMLDNADRFLVPFRKAGADFLTVHIEIYPDPRPVLDEIRSLGAEPGLAINPPTPAEALLPYLNDCSLALTMSVMPGFGGQEFNPVALDKIRRFRDLVGPDFLLSVDGGVNEKTIACCADAGANLFVAGTAVFQADDYGKQMQRLLGARD